MIERVIFVPVRTKICPPQHDNLVLAVLELHLQISLSFLQLCYQIAVALLDSAFHIMFACRTTLEALQFVLKFDDEFLEFLDLEATLLNLDFEVDVLFEGGIDLIYGELSKTFFEEMYTKFDVEVFFFK